jgi:hypothetical protein
MHETRELTLRFEEEGRSASKASHAGIIRIGFEGISQPHSVEHPCFNNQIETPPAGGVQMNWSGRKKARGENAPFLEIKPHKKLNGPSGFLTNRPLPPGMHFLSKKTVSALLQLLHLNG